MPPLRRYKFRTVYVPLGDGEFEVDLRDDEQVVSVENLGGQGPATRVVTIQQTTGKLAARKLHQNGHKHRWDGDDTP